MPLTHEELDSLVRQGVMDEQTGERLRAHYSESSPRRGQGNVGSVRRAHSSVTATKVAFGAVGAVLATLGLGLLLAEAWEYAGLFLRVVIALIPGLGSMAGVAYVYSRREDSVARETAIVIAFHGLGATIGLLSDTFFEGGEVIYVVTAWLALVSPLLLLRDATLTSVLMLLVVAACAVAAEEIALVFFVPIGAFVVRLHRERPRANVLLWHGVLIPLTGAVFLLSLSTETITLLLPGFMAMSCAITLLAGDGEAQMPRGLRAAAYVMLVIGLFSGSLENFWSPARLQSTASFLVAGVPFDLVFAAVAAAAAVAAGVVRLRRSTNRGHTFRDWGVRQRPAAAISLVAVATGFVGRISAFLGLVLTNLLLAAAGIWELYLGTRNGSLRSVNIGLALIASLVLIYLFEHDFSLVVRGVTLLVFGLIAAGLNIATSRSSSNRTRRSSGIPSQESN